MVLRVTFSFVMALGAYLVLAGQVSTTELMAGAVTAAHVAGFVGVLHLREKRRVRWSWAAARCFGRAVAGLPGDTVRVGLVLARAVVRAQGGAAGWQGLEAGDAGTRAAAVLGTSLSPNGIVVGLGPDGMLVHRLALP